MRRRRGGRAVAGGSAQQRFETLLHRWHRRKRRVFAVVFGVLLAPCLVTVVVGSGWWDTAAIFLAGAWVGMAMWVWDSPPEHIERVRRGAEGERQTAKELRRLQRHTWTAVHDIERRFGNWDHVIVGPAGVFLLDSKHLFGEAAIESGCLVVRRVDAPEELSRFDRLAPRLRGAAAELSHALTGSHGRPWVTPVVVVWPSLSPEAVEADGVEYVSGRHLVAWLAERRGIIGTERQRLVSAALMELAHRAAEMPPTTSASWRVRT